MKTNKRYALLNANGMPATSANPASVMNVVDRWLDSSGEPAVLGRIAQTVRPVDDRSV